MNPNTFPDSIQFLGIAPWTSKQVIDIQWSEWIMYIIRLLDKHAKLICQVQYTCYITKPIEYEISPTDNAIMTSDECDQVNNW